MVHPQSEVGPSAAALREWAGHVQSVLRGVAHALNNRAAAVSGVVELWNDPEGSGSNRALLEGEIRRLLELADAVRMIGAPDGQVEAFEPAEAVTAARVIIGLHADLRERSIAIDSASAPPVRTNKWMLVRELVAFAAAAALRGNKSGAATISVGGDESWVVIRATGEGLTPELTPYVLETARAMGGEPLADVPGFRLPSLAELRRREGR